jgi:hypothetical protein
VNDDDSVPTPPTPPERPFSPLMAYCQKVGHPSRKLALLARKRFVGIHDQIKGRRPSLNVFQCHNCNQWHIGNNDKLTTSRNRAERGVRVREKKFEHLRGDDE